MMTGDRCHPLPWDRWGRMCARFEDLIEEWLGESALPQPESDTTPAELTKMRREWSQQLASVAMAAQRVAGLRAMLCEITEHPDEEDNHGEAIDTPERRHWRALQSECEPDPDGE